MCCNGVWIYWGIFLLKQWIEGSGCLENYSKIYFASVNLGLYKLWVEIMQQLSAGECSPRCRLSSRRSSVCVAAGGGLLSTWVEPLGSFVAPSTEVGRTLLDLLRVLYSLGWLLSECSSLRSSLISATRVTFSCRVDSFLNETQVYIAGKEQLKPHKT